MTLTKNFDKLHARHGIFDVYFNTEYLRNMSGTLSSHSVSYSQDMLSFPTQTVTASWSSGTTGTIFVMPIIRDTLQEGRDNMTYDFSDDTEQKNVSREMSSDTTRTYNSDGTITYSTRYNTQVGTTIYGLAFCMATSALSSSRNILPTNTALLGYVRLDSPLVVTEPESRMLTYTIKGAAPAINIDDDV